MKRNLRPGHRVDVEDDRAKSKSLHSDKRAKMFLNAMDTAEDKERQGEEIPIKYQISAGEPTHLRLGAN